MFVTTVPCGEWGRGCAVESDWHRHYVFAISGLGKMLIQATIITC